MLSDSKFRVMDRFEIMVHGPVCKSFRMDMDPQEERQYGVLIDSGRLTQSFEYEIVARDQQFGFEAILRGNNQGFDPPTEFVSAEGLPTSAFQLGRTVTVKPPADNREHFSSSKFIIAVEDGTKNDFGIFNNHELNPTAAYIDIGRQGYKTLAGKHMVVLDWDRDTIAYPPSDLLAVHVRDITTNMHGWFFRGDLLLLREQFNAETI